MSEHIDAVDRDGLGDTLIGKVRFGNVDDFGWVEVSNRGRRECRRGGNLRKVFHKDERGTVD